MAHGAGALLSSALDGQALELMLGGQMVALEALKAQALQRKDAGLSTYVQRSC